MQYSISPAMRTHHESIPDFKTSHLNPSENRVFAETLNKVSPTPNDSPSSFSNKLAALYDKIATESTKDPEWAKKAAHHYGCEHIDVPLLYIGDWPIIRIESTREIFTPEKEEYFKTTADLYHEGRLNIYNSELAKGSHPLDILRKIFDYNNALPEEFRKMAGWL